MELLQKHDFLTVPLITGVTNDEGGWLLANVRLNTYIEFHARSLCYVFAIRLIPSVSPRSILGDKTGQRE